MNYSLVGPVYPYRGGIAHYTTFLAHTLEKQGHQVQVISFRKQYPKWLYPGKTDRDPSHQILTIEAEYIIAPFMPWTWLRAAQAIQRFTPDATIISWWTTFWAPAYWALSSTLMRNRIQVIFLIHNVLPHEERKFDVWLTRTVLKNANGYIVQSLREQQRLLSLLPNAKIAFHPHPIYPFFGEQTHPRKKAKEHIGIPIDRRVILFFGIVRPYKGLKYLIEATARLIDKGINAHLLIAGEFWEDKSQYLHQIKRLGVSNYITIDDRYIPNEELGWYFSAADIFVAPYSGGTQSGAVTLALGFGLPVVLTETIAQGLPQGDFNLRIVPSNNVVALAQAMEESIQNLPSTHESKPITSNDSWTSLVNVISTFTQPK